MRSTCGIFSAYATWIRYLHGARGALVAGRNRIEVLKCSGGVKRLLRRGLLACSMHCALAVARIMPAASAESFVLGSGARCKHDCGPWYSLVSGILPACPSAPVASCPPDSMAFAHRVVPWSLGPALDGPMFLQDTSPRRRRGLAALEASTSH